MVSLGNRREAKRMTTSSKANGFTYNGYEGTIGRPERPG